MTKFSRKQFFLTKNSSEEETAALLHKVHYVRTAQQIQFFHFMIDREDRKTRTMKITRVEKKNAKAD